MGRVAIPNNDVYLLSFWAGKDQQINSGNITVTMRLDDSARKITISFSQSSTSDWKIWCGRDLPSGSYRVHYDSIVYKAGGNTVSRIQFKSNNQTYNFGVDDNSILTANEKGYLPFLHYSKYNLTDGNNTALDDDITIEINNLTFTKI